MQQQKRHAIALWGWIADFSDPVSFLGLFRGDAGENWTGWSNPEYDRLIADAANTANVADRLELFQEAEALLLEEAPITPILHAARLYLLHPSVKGWAPSALGWPRYQLVSLEATP